MAKPKPKKLLGIKRGKPGRPPPRSKVVENAIRNGNKEEILRAVLDWNFYHIDYRAQDNLNLRDQWACFRQGLQLLAALKTSQDEEEGDEEELNRFIAKTVDQMIQGPKNQVEILPPDGEKSLTTPPKPKEKDL